LGQRERERERGGVLWFARRVCPLRTRTEFEECWIRRESPERQRAMGPGSSKWERH